MTAPGAFANETTTDDLSGAIASQWEGTLIKERREAQVVLQTVDMGAQMVGTGVKYWPKLATTAALTSISNGTNEADPQALTALTTTAASASPNAKALHVLSSWVSQAQSPINWPVEIPQAMARANVDIMETDAASLLSGFSNTAGTTGVKCRFQDLRQAIYKHRTVALSGAPAGLFVVHPYQADNVDEELQSGAGISLSTFMQRSDVVNMYGAMAGSGMLNVFRGGVMGVPLFTSTKVPNIGGSTGDHGGALYTPFDALGCGWNWIGRTNMDRQSVNLILGDSHQISSCYAFGEKDDSAGITLQTDHV